MKRDCHPEEFRVLVTLGESTTAGGWSSSRERCWSSRLAGLINDVQAEPVTLINSGIGANVISTRSPCYEGSGKPAASERLDQHVIAHQPDLLIISYGLNDARGGTPPGLFATEMEGLVDEVRRACDPIIVLPGPYFMTDFTVGGEGWQHADIEKFAAFNDVIAGVAAAKECLFADLLSAYGGAPWAVHYDGCHANDVGHLLVANKIFEVVVQNCSGIAANTKAKERSAPRWRDESTLMANYGH